MTDTHVNATYNDNIVLKNIDEVEEYLSGFADTRKSKSNKKMTDESFRMISMSEYDLVKTNKYKVSQLKAICKFYQMKVSGNKEELITRIYNYLKNSLYAIKIQRRARGHLLRKYIHSCGPSLKNRKLCINDTDFASLEPVGEIPFNQFFSFTDDKNNIYGCDIVSFYGLLQKKTIAVNKSNKVALNPYTREVINNELRSKFSLRLRLARVNRIEHIVIEEPEIVDHVKQMEFKVIELFQYINELGNYADSKWFTDLSKNMTIIFIREMYDIWTYRAQLSTSVMREIVPPHGNPFTGASLHLAQSQSEEYVKKQAVRIIELMVKSGHTEENRSLGAFYVLSALTLVSDPARIALPWLFQSVAH